MLPTLYSPICWLLAGSLALLLVLWVDRRRGRVARLAAGLYLALWLLVYLLATPFGSAVMRATLTRTWPEPENFEPQYILVVAMGYIRTSDPLSNVLNDGTALRVAAAANWHRAHPDALLVMQGSSGSSALGDDHQARLMAAFAGTFGVPEDKILLEPFSRNTREHVRQFRKLTNAGRDSPIGIVSSDWHLRRVAMEFNRAFDRVCYRAADGHGAAPPRGWRALVPRERELLASAFYVREWFAMAWYFVYRPAVE
jgi:uncharacterized SAM-binding protein YcdF (DUF218 family)